MAPKRTDAAFQLHPGEPVPRGIRRIVRAQLGDAAASLSSGGEPGAAVHGARKNFKRVRSTLRLLAGPLDDAVRRRENAVIREAGRSLSRARDGQVMLETFDALAAREGLVADGFRRQLAELNERAQAELGSEREQLGEVARALHQAKQRVGSWEIAGGPKQRRLTPGLVKIYRRGRRDYRRARSETSAESLHEWRKRVKDLWYGAQILRPLAPRRMKKLAGRAHHLADLLGDEHDLAVLRAEAVRYAGDPAERERVLVAVDRRSGELRQEAFAAGRRLYGRKGAEFERRLRR